nr:hypothetical protein 3 [bacterium]
MRFSLGKLDSQGPLYVAACYSRTGDGLRYTRQWEDACSYVTIERAAAVAVALNDLHGDSFTILENNQ